MKMQKPGGDNLPINALVPADGGVHARAVVSASIQPGLALSVQFRPVHTVLLDCT